MKQRKKKIEKFKNITRKITSKEETLITKKERKFVECAV